MKVDSGIGKMLNFTHRFEPKSFVVHKISLMAIVVSEEKGLEIRVIWEPKTNRKEPLNTALSQIMLSLHNLSPSVQRKILLPIFCLGGVEPYFEGVKAFLAENLHVSIRQEIKALALQNPMELTFSTGKREIGALVKTVIDFSKERILILGNVDKVIQQLKIICDTFYFSTRDPTQLAEKLRHTFDTYVNRPLGSHILIGSFGAIFTFISAILVNKFISQSYSSGESFALLVSLFSIACYLCMEGFEHRIIAFSPKEVVYYALISWCLFLAFILGTPFILFVLADGQFAYKFLRLMAIGIVFFCILRTLRSVFFEKGLTKNSVLVLWAFLFFLLWFIF